MGKCLVEDEIKNALGKFLFCPNNDETRQQILNELRLVLEKFVATVSLEDESDESNIRVGVTIDGVETYEFCYK